jgi:hypothetical protein
MKRLTTYLENPFDDYSISMAELIAFSTDHSQRMIANNDDGQFDDEIPLLTAVLAQVEEHVTDDQGLLGIRKARKQAKDNFRETTIPADVKRIEAGFTAAFGGDSPILLEALPTGRSIFQTCRDDQMTSHLQTLLNAVTRHQASLAPATLTQATALRNNWATLYQASEVSTGNKSVTQLGKKEARQALQLQLFLNLLKLGSMFPRQPEKLSTYMQQHLLENPGSAEEPPANPVAPVV